MDLFQQLADDHGWCLPAWKMDMGDHLENVRARKKWLWVKVCFGLGTFALLFWLFDPKATLAMLATASIPHLFLALLSGVVVLMARSLRWLVIMRDMGFQARFWRIVEIYGISLWFNTFLPGSVGGDAYKVYGLIQDGSKPIQSFATVLMERLSGLGALVSIAIFSVMGFGHLMPIPSWMLLSLILMVAALVSGVLFSVRLIEPGARMLRQRFPRMCKRMTDERIRLLADVFQDLIRNKRLLLRAYILGVLLQLLVLVSYYVVSLALNERISILFFLVFFPLIEIVSLIPITVNGMGIRELMLAVFLQYAGVGPSYAIGFSILLRLILVVLALAGGLLLVVRPGTVGNRPENVFK